MEQNFIDYVKICCRSGKGGAGSAHFFRSRLNPRGGPDGGDGGRGGHIVLRGNKQQWTLLSLKYRKHVYAGDGVNGSKSNCTGADGDDIILDVPLGTVARLDGSTQVIAEITEEGQKVVLLRGGRGGQGNTHFKSSTHQSPRYAQPGEEGTEHWIILELKVLADVGLVGFPNAGKSTLLASITAAKPKIADYAFTTLVPNLGIVPYREHYSFVMADIPGIIEGASQGKGLGYRFLRHIERNAVLLFLVPADSPDHAKEYHILLQELEAFNKELLHKDRILAISKSDLLDDELQKAIKKELNEALKHEKAPKTEVLFFSSVTGKGLSTLKDHLWKKLNAPAL
ncbi:MAG: GTPase ObgE [Bacteroidetes bacterium]|nr:GTPase ObgE [Bacteroidota bacterium]